MPQRDIDQVLTEKHEAFAVLDVKAITEDDKSYTIKGIASTPTVDRMGDIVEPLGARFALPMALLWQHNSDKPVGNVVAAKPGKKGIPYEATIPKVTEPGALKDRIDEAIQSIKYNLVAAVSIGFRAIRDKMEFMDGGGIRFLEWEWLELSLVTIPANPEATITSLKSFDNELRAALGRKQRGVVRLNPPLPGAAGSIAAPAQGHHSMKTYKEQIAALEATRAAKAARMAEIQQKASEGGRTKDVAEKEEFDTLSQDIGQLDSELKDLRDLEKLNIAQAESALETRGAPAAGTAGTVSPRITVVQTKLEPGIRFARMAMALARAKAFQREGRFVSPDQVYRSEKRWMDTAPDVELALKTAVNANDSTTSAGASEWAYAQNVASEFIEYLRPRTLIGRIQGWRNVPFNVRIGGMDGGATGYWVGQGLAIPASRQTSTSVSLGITKVAGLSVITKELAMLSTPSAELMVRNDLARTVQQKMDTSLIDPNSGGVANVTPASLTYGATARQASGTDYAAFKADWKAMTTNFYANNISMEGAVIIMKEELAEALALMVTSLGNPQFPGLSPTGGTLMGRPVFVTQVADTSGSPDFDNMLILLQPSEVFLADDGVATVEASDQVSVEMVDSSSQKSSATAAGASLVSMFQTESIAIKGVRHVNWTKARAQACQYIRSAAYV